MHTIGDGTLYRRPSLIILTAALIGFGALCWSNSSFAGNPQSSSNTQPPRLDELNHTDTLSGIGARSRDTDVQPFVLPSTIDKNDPYLKTVPLYVVGEDEAKLVWIITPNGRLFKERSEVVWPLGWSKSPITPGGYVYQERDKNGGYRYVSVNPADIDRDSGNFKPKVLKEGVYTPSTARP